LKRGGSQRLDDLPAGWTSYIDEASGAPVYEHESGITQWDHPGPPEDSHAVEMVQSENPLRAGQQAAGGHGRNATQLPSGWSKDYTEEGDGYYVDDQSGETSWEPPAGSTGGSTGISAEIYIDGGSGSGHTRNKTAGFLDDGEKYYEDANGETTWDEYTL
jgi:hypothetical protein